jgi:uncharacterized protein YjbJ (UPF0337 family)
MNKLMIVAGATVIGLALASPVAHAQGTLDKIEGTATELKGAAKDTVGSATGDTHLEWSGKIDKVEGAAQNGVGELKDTAGGINAGIASLFARLGNYFAGLF